MKNKLGKIALISLISVGLVGCGKIPTLKNGEEVIVSTKEGKITANDLYETLKDKYGSEVIIDLMDQLILNEKYKADDEENDYIDEQMDKLEEQAKQYNYTVEQYVKAAGFNSLDDAKDYLRLNYRRELAVKDYVKDDITDKEIEKYYEDEVYQDIDCKHILIAVDSSASEETDKAAKKKALEVIKKLNKGKKFDDLAKEYSDDDSTKDKGGDLGYFNKGDMVEEFEEAAYKLKKGKYTTEPVKTTYGYHIIYKVDEKKKESLKNMKSEIIDTLVSDKLSNDSTLYYSTLEKIRKDNGLDIIDSDLSKGYASNMAKLTSSKNSSN